MVPALIAEAVIALVGGCEASTREKAGEGEREGEDSTRAPSSGLRYALALDLGCGTGLLGRELEAHSAVLLGVDLSSGMLTRAEEQGVCVVDVRSLLHHLTPS